MNMTDHLLVCASEELIEFAIAWSYLERNFEFSNASANQDKEYREAFKAMLHEYNDVAAVFTLLEQCAQERFFGEASLVEDIPSPDISALELSKLIHKSLRFGLEAKQPITGETNLEMLKKLSKDFFLTMYVYEQMLGSERFLNSEAMKKKMNKLSIYMKKSVRFGTLEF